MRLSDLQKYILASCHGAGGRCGRKRMITYYETRKKPSHKDQVDAVTKTLERLIDRGFLVGYGVRTPKKWYIKDVRLTLAGRKIVRLLRGTQQKLFK